MLQLLKTNDTHKTVSFCVLTPDIEDRNNDVISEDEIIKTAHDFVINLGSKYLNVDHEKNTEFDITEYKFVESFIAPNDIIVGDNIVKKGSWYVGIKFLSDTLYEAVKKGEYVGISMEGYFINE